MSYLYLSRLFSSQGEFTFRRSPCRILQANSLLADPYGIARLPEISLTVVRMEPHDHSMQTKITLDPEIALELKALAHRQGVSLDDMLNEVLRTG